MEKNNGLLLNLTPYALDAVFCIDASASMLHGLQEFKKCIDAICEEFAKEFERRGRELVSFRVRFVVFRDFLTDGYEALLATDFIDLINENIDFKTLLAEIDAHGGISPLRSGLEALAFAMYSRWLTNGFDDKNNVKYRHVIISISDSGTRELRECRNVPNYPMWMPSSFEELTDLWRTSPPDLMMYIAAPDNSGWKNIRWMGKNSS